MADLNAHGVVPVRVHTDSRAELGAHVVFTVVQVRLRVRQLGHVSSVGGALYDVPGSYKLLRPVLISVP